MRIPAALLLAFALPLALPAQAADAEGFVVLRIAKGDDVVFKVVPAGSAAGEKKSAEAEAKDAIEAWKRAKADFERDKANRGKEFLEPRPDEAKVTRAKDFPTEAEAKAFAEEERKKAEGKYAVVQVKGTNGETSYRAVRQNTLRSLEANMLRDYAKRMADWEAAKKAYYEDTVVIGGPKQPFSKPMPSKPELKKLKDGLADQAAADAAVAELESKKKR